MFLTYLNGTTRLKKCCFSSAFDLKVVKVKAEFVIFNAYILLQPRKI